MSRSGTRVAVAVSGKARSLRNLIQAQRFHGYGYEVAGVIASAPGTGGEGLSEEYLLPLFEGNFGRAQVAETAKRLALWLRENQIDWIALAGFLKLFPDLPGYENKVINIHPALLPHFGGKGMYGMKVHDAVRAKGDVISGPTIHLVDGEYDRGRILAQQPVSLIGATDAHEIADRVFAAECQLYPRVLDQLVRQGLQSFTKEKHHGSC